MKSKIIISLFVFLISAASWSQQVKDTGIVIKVLSFNVYHGATTLKNYDIDVIAKVIKDADPDFVALQEVDFRTNRNGKKDFATELGCRVNMIPLFGRSIYYDHGEYGLGILSKYTFIQSRRLLLPGTPGYEQRSALEIMTVLPSGDTILFIGTHFDHQSEKDREAQAKKINKEFATGRYPAILAGDLNADPQSTPVGILEKHWLKTYDATNPEPTYPSSSPEVKIDYVMCYPKGRWEAIKSTVIRDTVASDHCPYFVLLKLTGKK